MLTSRHGAEIADCNCLCSIVSSIKLVLFVLNVLVMVVDLCFDGYGWNRWMFDFLMLGQQAILPAFSGYLDFDVISLNTLLYIDIQPHRIGRNNERLRELSNKDPDLCCQNKAGYTANQ